LHSDARALDIGATPEVGLFFTARTSLEASEEGVAAAAVRRGW
jgi:hypothetical protein